MSDEQREPCRCELLTMLNLNVGLFPCGCMGAPEVKGWDDTVGRLVFHPRPLSEGQPGGKPA